MSENKIQSAVYQIETTAAEGQIKAREKLQMLLEQSELSKEDFLFNLGLYTRGSLLVKYLVMHELYKIFKTVPGVLVEFGTWYGQNMVLLENLRAIHEPFNKQRKIIVFDTFNGYQSVTEKDKDSQVWSDFSYNSGNNYEKYLNELIQTHETMNVLGHINGCHETVAGDVSETAPAYFEKNNHLIVAFAYFDMGVYKPTKAALHAIKKHLVKGSILVMDELTWPEAPGEALAFKEEMADIPHEITKCELYPSKAIIKIL